MIHSLVPTKQKNVITKPSNREPTKEKYHPETWTWI